jgi:hypothetical protein
VAIKLSVAEVMLINYLYHVSVLTSPPFALPYYRNFVTLTEVTDHNRLVPRACVAGLLLSRP